MDKQELDAIRERCAKATPGPWHRDGSEVRNGDGVFVVNDFWVHADAEFTTHARTDIPALLAEIDRLNNDLIKQREAIAIFLGNNGIRLFANDTTEDFIKALDGNKDYLGGNGENG
ncbi:hypothetical protein C1I38_08110 [Dehalobacter sp. 12DCB1]|nr:hypothetical protein C1I36_06430 [Dehalobacter sp. 14DCB1]TCX53010.1 hypothetical protein C1I38_08110 [Dehalobacter sp. 12DCB1]